MAIRSSRRRISTGCAPESVRFEDFHVSPTCAPTRSALFTGRHEFKNGVTHTILERERLAPGAVTLAQDLRDAGYATGIFGKWHLGDEDEYQPSARGLTRCSSTAPAASASPIPAPAATRPATSISTPPSCTTASS
jgi:arylsulfatase A-like enzyme